MFSKYRLLNINILGKLLLLTFWPFPRLPWLKQRSSRCSPWHLYPAVLQSLTGNSMDPRHQVPSRPENKSLNSYLICRNFTFVRRVFGDKLTESEKTSACFYQALSYNVRVNGKRSLVTRLNWSQGRNADKSENSRANLKQLKAKKQNQKAIFSGCRQTVRNVVQSELPLGLYTKKVVHWWTIFDFSYRFYSNSLEQNTVTARRNGWELKERGGTGERGISASLPKNPFSFSLLPFFFLRVSSPPPPPFPPSPFRT